MTPIDPKIAPPIYAWVGDDELGDSGVGLKQAMTPLGFIPLAFVEGHLQKAMRYAPALHQQAIEYEKTIRLVRYVAVEIVEELS